MSTTEAEYMALIAATLEVMFLKQMLLEFHQDSGSAIAIHEDNQRCIALSKNSMTSGRGKDMDVRYHFYLEKVDSGDIEVQYCATENMLAVVLTKPLVSAKHNKLCNAIEIEIEIVRREPAKWTGSHLSGLYTQPYRTYEQVLPGFSSTRYTCNAIMGLPA
jgi:hypothetical protein